MSLAINDSQPRTSSLYIQNVSGAKSKIVSLNAALLATIFNIVIFIETWFDRSVLSPELLHNTRFNISRRDRAESASESKIGGGTAILFDSNIACKPHSIINDYSKHIMESSSVIVNANSIVTLICAIYIPPISHRIGLKNLRQLLQKASKDKSIHHLCLAGDFNLPGIEWSFADEDSSFLTPVISVFSTDAATFIEIIAEFGLCQINSTPNANGKFLDLVLVTNPEDYAMANGAIVAPFDRSTQHHSPLAFETNIISHSWNKVTTRYQLDLPKSSCLIDQSRVIEQNDPENIITELFTIQHNSTIVKQSSSPSWLSRHPWLAGSSRYADLHKLQRRLYSKYKSQPNPENKTAYNECYITTVELHNALKSDYMMKVVDTPTSNSRQFYSLMKSKTGKDIAMPSKLYHDGVWISGAQLQQKMYEQLALNFSYDDNFFSKDESILQNQLTRIHHAHFIPSHLWNNIDIEPTSEEILREIYQLKTKKGSGPHQVSASFLQYNATKLLPHLSNVIQQAYATGICPETWKESYIQPIPKKGPLSSLSNYRGIAISSCIPKILDRLIAKRLNAAADNILSPNQHGFRKGRSTTTNLLDFSQRIHSHLHEGHQVDVIYFDISKAFDQINHRILAEKLARLGMPLQLFKITMSFVVNRKYRLRMHDRPTDLIITPSSAVPQGSCCGPALYLFYSDDALLHDDRVFKSAYADDTKLMLVIRSLEDIDIMQQAINEFSQWCALNKLKINVGKTTFVSYARRARKFDSAYAIDGKVIDRSTTVRDLGILFDDRLSFRTHIEDICHRASSMLAVAKRFAAEAKNNMIVFKIFQCHIAPILEYNSIVWNQQAVGLSFNIEQIKRQVTRIALRIPPNPTAYNYRDYLTRSSELNTITMEHRRVLLALSTVVKLLIGVLQSENRQIIIDSLVQQRSTRNPNIFNESNRLPPKSPLSIIMRMVNKHAQYFSIQQTPQTLKIKMKKMFLNIYANNVNSIDADA